MPGHLRRWQSPRSSICHVLHDGRCCRHGTSHNLCIPSFIQASGHGEKKSSTKNSTRRCSPETAIYTQSIWFRQCSFTRGIESIICHQRISLAMIMQLLNLQYRVDFRPHHDSRRRQTLKWKRFKRSYKIAVEVILLDLQGVSSMKKYLETLSQMRSHNKRR